MAANYNHVVLMGTLTRDPDLRSTSNGTSVCDIGLAVNENYTKNGQKVEEVSYFDVTAFGRHAEVVREYCSKGSHVMVAGRLKQDRWEADGAKRSKVKIIAERLQLVGGKGNPRNPDPEQEAHFKKSDEDCPF